ncbi:MAG: GNAT family N-acetyltransferase [Leadbetterella sp.]|nr:GNAT family N-acetyltransferase [Leadbetterella sp.]
MGIAGEGLSYRTFRGAGIREATDALAALRITVFRDYPYLYDGDPAYEKEYLKTYINSEKSLLFSVFEGKQMVGATTCIPLADETEDVRKPFREKGMDVGGIFYFGESILLKSYRGQGLGNRFFEEREAHAALFPGVSTMCFCAVKRPADHPRRPGDYQPLDIFWGKRGYAKAPDMVSYFEWKDLGEEISTAKPMEYWFKKI